MFVCLCVCIEGLKKLWIPGIISNQYSKIQSLKAKFFVNNEIDFELVSLSDINKSKIKEAFQQVKDKFQKEWNSEIDIISELLSTPHC